MAGATLLGVESHLLGSLPSAVVGLQESFKTSGLRGILSTVVSSEILKEFGDAVSPPFHFKMEVNQHICYVTGVIQTQPTLDIARFAVAGSYGRRTAVGSYDDVEVVVIVNGLEPPYNVGVDCVMYRLWDKLQELYPYRGQQFHVCPWVEGQEWVEVSVKNSRVRFVAAPNLSEDSEEQRISAQNMIEQEVRKRGLEAGRAWFPCLIERSIKCFTEAEADDISFIRFCKYWIYICDLPIDPYAVEVMALAICRELHEAGLKDLDALDAFKRFLYYLRNPTRINRLNNILQPAHYLWLWVDSTPCLVDRVNPYENLVEDVTEIEWQCLAYHAGEMLRRLSNKLTVDGLLSPILVPRELPKVTIKKRGTRHWVWFMALVPIAACVLALPSFGDAPGAIANFQAQSISVVRLARVEAEVWLRSLVAWVFSLQNSFWPA